MNKHRENFMIRVLEMTLSSFMDDVISESRMLELFDQWCEYVSKNN
jgi:hypothetical protein